MSYRLITRATLTIVAATGVPTTRELDVRAYPAPKRDAAGAITVDGNATVYRRTGGKGRGTMDRRYAYATVKAQSAYFEITEAEANAMIGGTITLATIAAATPTPAVVAPIPDAEQGEPSLKMTADEQAEQDATPAPKAPRRVKGQAKGQAKDTTEA